MPPETSSPPVAAPVTNAGAAPPADPVANPYGSHQELLDDIASLSPEEATELLNEYRASYHAPTPAPLVPSTPAEANARLAQLRCDAAWCRRLTAGDIATAEEFHKLSELAASAAPFDPSDDVADWSSGPGLGDHLSRRNMLSAADGLRRDGFNEEAIVHILNGGVFTTETVRDAQFWLPRMQADTTLLSPDLPPDRNYQMKVYRAIIAIGDGRGP
jgi:hypothetical protein